MPGQIVKQVKLRITADDGNTEQKLDSIGRKADELGRKHPELKVRIDSAAASAKLGVLRKELKDTAQQAQTTKGRFGSLGQAVNLFATGGLSGGISEMSMFQKILMGVNLATGLAEPLLAGVIVAAGGLGAGFAAAGLGAGIFGEVTKGVFADIKTNITAATAAEDKMATARTLKQQTADAKEFDKALKGLNPGEKSLTIASANAESGWHSFTRNAAGGVASVLVPALNLVPKALSLMQPFLAPVEASLRGIVADVSKGLNSSGFKSFLDMMQRNTGPMITGIATAVGHVVVGLGGIIRAFMPVSHTLIPGLDSITAKFAKWGQSLTGHSGFQDLMHMFRTETPLVVGALTQLAGIAKTVVSQMTGMDTFSNSKMLLQLALPVLKLVNALLKAHPELIWLVLYLKLAFDGGKKLQTAFQGLQSGLGVLKGAKSGLQDVRAGFTNASAAASDATGILGTFGGKISTMVSAIKEWGIWSKIASGATKVWTAIQAGFDIVMDANPIGLVVIAIAALIAIIVVVSMHVKVFRDFWKDAWHDITAAITVAFDWVKGHWPLIVGILLGPVALVAGAIIQHWHAIYDGTKTVLGDVISFFRALPGRIVSAVGNLGRLLWNAGASLLRGLLGGIESMVGDVVGAAEHVGSSILHGIEDVLGIFSPSREARKRAQLVGQGLRLGLLDSVPMVDQASRHLASSMLAGYSGGSARGAAAAAGAGGGAVTVQVTVNGFVGNNTELAKEIQTALHGLKRKRGGAALGLA